ncbi:hypothetical protein BG004_002814 [Podila humilis]|nr:hypothetical protein BG004_002814 [Podila humilis]
MLHVLLAAFAKPPQYQHQKNPQDLYQNVASSPHGHDGNGPSRNDNDPQYYPHPGHSRSWSEVRNPNSQTPSSYLPPISTLALDIGPSADCMSAFTNRQMAMDNKHSKGSGIDQPFREHDPKSHQTPFCPPLLRRQSISQNDLQLFRSLSNDRVQSSEAEEMTTEKLELSSVRVDRLKKGPLTKEHASLTTDQLERMIDGLGVATGDGQSPSKQHTPIPSTASYCNSTPRIDPARLSRIRAQVVAFLGHRYSVHDYTVPRLFVVLPDPNASPSSNDESTINSYRLYFLCECSPSFTLPLGSGLNHLHIAKHVGYAIELGRLSEFFKRYGHMILNLLIFLHYGQESAHTTTSSDQPSFSKRQSLVGQDSKPAAHGFDQRQEELQVLKRVEKLSSLRRSDLPQALAQDMEVRVSKMIEFLESLLFPDDNITSTQSGKPASKGSAGTDFGAQKHPSQDDSVEEPLRGLVNINDLHELYSYLGMANFSTRLQTGQLGNMFRISNVKGQVSWVCTYHYRWTFLEKNVDDFERWITTRGGLFDKPTGALSITLVSRAHTRTFCSWIANKVAPSLIEVHLRLGWPFGKKDLWRLARALAQSTVTVLSLDGCADIDDPGYMSLHKKYDPILHLISHGQLRSLELRRLPSMFARMSQKTVKAPSLRRLELGPGMIVDSETRGVLASFLSSCSGLQDLVLPGFRISDYHLQSIFMGVRSNHALTTLNIPGSFVDDGAAIVLAQGLFSTSICHLDLSRNERLTDVGATRVIRAVGPRLTSLKMAQTGFGDGAATALAKSMDGISITTTLRDQLQMQHRLDIAALTAGHRPGIRVRIGGGDVGGDTVFPAIAASLSDPVVTESRKQTHAVGHLVYLDIEDNQCTQQGFHELAKIKSRLYLTYLNLAGSAGLEDDECARILERVASAELRTLRLSFTGFGDQSAKALANSLLETPVQPLSNNMESREETPEGPLCHLTELDLQGCIIGTEGTGALCHALDQCRVASRLKILDFGHCPNLNDHHGMQLVKTLLLPTVVDRMMPTSSPTPLEGFREESAIDMRSPSIATIPLRQNSFSQDQYDLGMAARRKSAMRTGPVQGQGLLVMSESTPAQLGHTMSENGLPVIASPSMQPSAVIVSDDPPRILHMPPIGFFSNVRQLDLKSTLIGDDTAFGLAQVLFQPWLLLESLTVLEPASMTLQGLCWIVEAMCENMTVTEFGIGQSNMIIRDYDNGERNEYDRFGAALVNLLELNKRLRSLTTISAPLGAVAKGLLLNQSLHSLYLIRSKGVLEDLQLMGQALGFNRALLVFWMGASDESLLGNLQPPVFVPSALPDDGSRPFGAADQMHVESQYTHNQKTQHTRSEHENVYRNFHLHHQQKQHEQQFQQQQHLQQQQQQHKNRLHGHQKVDLKPHRLKALVQNRFGLDQESQASQHRSLRHRHQRTISHTSIPHHSPSLTRTRSMDRVPTMSSSRGDGRYRTSHAPSMPATSRVFPANTGTSVGGVGAVLSNNVMTTLTRNPLMEGIRRNHSLIKVVLDLVVPTAAMPISHTLTATSTVQQQQQQQAFQRQNTRQSMISQQMEGGSGGALSSEAIYNAQFQQQQQLNKKMAINRKLLRDRGRVGWEELKLLGIDDDIVREVCNSGEYFF